MGFGDEETMNRFNEQLPGLIGIHKPVEKRGGTRSLQQQSFSVVNRLVQL
jgi:hypothetical protein